MKKLLCIAAMSASMNHLPLYAADEYHFTPFQLGGTPHAINNLNQVVGSLNNQAFFWDNGVMTDLGLGDWSVANDINDSGSIIGHRNSPDDQALRNVFIYEADGTVINTNIDGRRTSAKINNNGQAMIDYGYRNFDSYGFFVENGNRSDINIDTHTNQYPGSGSTFVYANDLNNAGQVVGEIGSTFLNLGLPKEGFVWQNGTNTSLGNFLPDEINDSGQMIGRLGGKATFYEAGNYIGLGDSFSAIALNNAGQILGVGPEGYQIWQNGTVTKLGELLDNSIDGWTIKSLKDFNDNGWLTGQAVNDLTGDRHMFVLSPTSDVSPVPEANTFVLVGFGLLGFIAFSSRQGVTSTAST